MKPIPIASMTRPAHRLAFTPPVLSSSLSPKIPISVRITPYRPIRPPMMLRMSKAPAVCWFCAMTGYLEDHVQDDDQHQRHTGESQRARVPLACGLVRVDEVLTWGLGVDETAQLLDRLRLRDDRD